MQAVMMERPRESWNQLVLGTADHVESDTDSNCMRLGMVTAVVLERCYLCHGNM